MPEAKRSIPARPKTRRLFKAYADRRRLKLVEVSDLAIAALNALPKQQQDQLIEHGKLSPASA